MGLSPILVGGVSRRCRGRSIRRPGACRLRQQPPQGGKRANADPRSGRHGQRHAGLPLEHPSRHLEAPAGVPGEAAPQRGGVPSFAHLMDVDGETAPRMPRVQERPFRGPVGVRASGCTTPSGRTARSATARPRRRWSCRDRQGRSAARIRPGQHRPLPCSTKILPGPLDGGWSRRSRLIPKGVERSAVSQARHGVDADGRPAGDALSPLVECHPLAFELDVSAVEHARGGVVSAANGECLADLEPAEIDHL